jgi:hypothetical protein
MIFSSPSFKHRNQFLVIQLAHDMLNMGLYRAPQQEAGRRDQHNSCIDNLEKSILNSRFLGYDNQWN